jgi:hypothetical protein
MRSTAVPSHADGQTRIERIATRGRQRGNRAVHV